MRRGERDGFGVSDPGGGGPVSDVGPDKVAEWQECWISFRKIVVMVERLTKALGRPNLSHHGTQQHTSRESINRAPTLLGKS